MYAFTAQRGRDSILILRFDKIDEAIALLRDSGIVIADKIVLFAR